MLKTVSSLGNIIGALVYKGTWDASTNTPTLTSSVGNKGDYYVVSVAGNTNLNGITDWQVNDFAVFNGTVWQKIDNTDAVLSVNGQTGAVVLTATDVGATANTTYVLAGGLLSGGGQLNANVTLSLTSVPVANVPGAVPNTVNVLTSGLLSGGGALTGNVTVSLTSVPVANVTGAVPNTVNVIAGTGLSGGGALTGNITINIANTAVSAGTYGSAVNVAQVTIDAQGRVTSASNVAIAIANSAVSGLGTMSIQNANSVAITGGNVTANVSLTNATNASATFATSSLPLVPAGYLKFQLANATVVLVPYYAQ
jgi:hypothetical protein